MGRSARELRHRVGVNGGVPSNPLHREIVPRPLSPQTKMSSSAARKSPATDQKASAKAKPAVKSTKKSTKRGPSKRVVHSASVYEDTKWKVCFGELQKPKKPGPVARSEPVPLFRIVGEKLPYSSLAKVRDSVKAHLGKEPNGVYVAHDSMGCPRYVGRGKIFERLQVRHKVNSHELALFSFYVVDQKSHEGEVETLLIRAAGFLLEFNEKKKRVGIGPGSVRDYEPGTFFFERHYKRGMKPPKKKVPKKLK